MKIGKSDTTTVLRRLAEFSQVDKAAEKRIDKVLKKYGITYYPSTSEVIGPIDTEFDYDEWKEIIEEIREAIASE